jgi:3-dehydroquinate dehydratase-2
MRILLINGPNLNLLGTREPEIYGRLTLKQIESQVSERAKALGADVLAFQSNHEGEIVDFLQQQAPKADGIIINAGALTHYGLSIRDALIAVGKPAVEVHISNVHARDWYRRRSVMADICTGVIAGLGAYGYIAALEALVQPQPRRTRAAAKRPAVKRRR